jgi:hypothetical protein
MVPVLLLGGLLLAGEARAFRCGSDLIQPGDRQIQVLAACGEPVSRYGWEEIQSGRFSRYGRLWDTVEKVQVEEWVYNQGPQYFLRILRFKNGELVKIERGDYGF